MTDAQTDCRSLNLKILNRCLLALLAVSLALYLVIHNNFIAKSFAVKNLMNNKDKLLEQNTALEVQTSTLRSYQNVSLRLKSLGLVKIDGAARQVYQPSSVSYLRPASHP